MLRPQHGPNVQPEQTTKLETFAAPFLSCIATCELALYKCHNNNNNLQQDS